MRRTRRRRRRTRTQRRIYIFLTIAFIIFGAIGANTNVDFANFLPDIDLNAPAQSTATPLPASISEDSELTQAVVQRVIDGDTIVLTTGERVRFIGVDAPEIGEEGADEATQFVRDLIDGQTIWLEADDRDVDAFGRLRRYIWLQEPTDVNDEQQIRSYMLNAMMLEEGHAVVAIFGNVRHEALFRNLSRP